MILYKMNTNECLRLRTSNFPIRESSKTFRKIEKKEDLTIRPF